MSEMISWLRPDVRPALETLVDYVHANPDVLDLVPASHESESADAWTWTGLDLYRAVRTHSGGALAPLPPEGWQDFAIFILGALYAERAQASRARHAKPPAQRSTQPD